MSELVLVYPPAALPSEPPLGVHSLAAALRQAGARVRVVDANIEALHALLAAVPLEAARDAAERRALKQRERALVQLREAHAYGDRDRHRSAVSALQRVLSLVPGRGRPELADYRDPGASPLRRHDLLAAATTPELSPYYAYFQGLVARILAEKPHAVGLSINYLHQALPAMALAGMLRAALPEEVPVVGGGGLIRCWRQQLGPEGLGPGIDRLFFGAGEAPLWALLGKAGPGPLDALPDYGEAPWPLYLAPRAALPWSTSSGCYWRRCRYCPEAVEGPPFAAGRAPMAETFARLASQRSPAMIHLTDSALPPRTLREAATLEGELPWYGFARFHPDLADPAFCRQLRRGGCTMLQLGLESGSARTLERLNKGIDLALASRALQALAASGIATYVYVMFGVPGESRTEAELTLRFVQEHAPWIRFINASLLNLPHGAPEEPGLIAQEREGQADLSLYANFESADSWQRKQARAFMDKVFARQPEVAAVIRRTPHIFGACHAAFVALHA